MSEPVQTSDARGFLGLDRSGWPGTIVVALIVAIIAVGLPLANSLVSADRPLTPGSVVDVGRGVSFAAADGWSLDAERTDARAGRTVVTQDAVAFRVEAGVSDRTLAEEYERLAGEIRGGSGAQVFNGAGAIVTDSGLSGIAGTYGSPEAEGVFAVFMAGETVVRVVAKGPPDAMASGLEDVTAMIRSLEVRA